MADITVVKCCRVFLRAEVGYPVDLLFEQGTSMYKKLEVTLFMIIKPLLSAE